MNWTPATLRARNPFPCHTSEKSPHNSNHCHTSKTAVFNPCVCHTSETPPGGPLFQLGNLPLSCHTSSSFFSYSCALFSKNHPGWGYPCSSAFRGECPQGSNRRTCKPSALRSVVSSLGAGPRKSRHQ